MTHDTTDDTKNTAQDATPDATTPQNVINYIISTLRDVQDHLTAAQRHLDTLEIFVAYLEKD